MREFYLGRRKDAKPRAFLRFGKTGMPYTKEFRHFVYFGPWMAEWFTGSRERIDNFFA
jgi:hypothetical protein